MSSIEICHCNCHYEENIEHCMPCCYKCKHCNDNIIPYYYEEHILKCAKKIKDLTNLIFNGEATFK